MDIIRLLQELGKLSVKDKDILAKLDEWKAQQMASIDYLTTFSGTLKKENEGLVAENTKLKGEKEDLIESIGKEKEQIKKEKELLDRKINDNNAILDEIEEREALLEKESNRLTKRETELSKIDSQNIEKGRELLNEGIILQDKIRQAELEKIQYTTLIASLDDKEKRLNDKEKEITTKEKELDYKNERYTEKVMFLTKKENEIEEKRKSNEQTQAQLISQDALIKMKRGELGNREAIIVKIEKELKDKEENIVQREEKIKADLKSIELRELEIRKDRADIIEERNRQNVIIKERNLSITN